MFVPEDRQVIGSYFSHRSGSVIAMLGLIFSQIGMGHLDLLTNAMKSGKLGNFAVDKNYISAGALIIAIESRFDLQYKAHI